MSRTEFSTTTPECGIMKSPATDVVAENKWGLEPGHYFRFVYPTRSASECRVRRRHTFTVAEEVLRIEVQYIREIRAFTDWHGPYKTGAGARRAGLARRKPFAFLEPVTEVVLFGAGPVKPKATPKG